MKYYIIIIITILIVGCKKELKNPELLDFIYKDLVSELKQTISELESEKKNLNELKIILKKQVPRSIGLKTTKIDLLKSKNKIDTLSQKKIFYEIRSKRRKIESRIAYKKAFKANRNWPDILEKKNYLTNKKLNQASRNWSKRVPKLFKNKLKDEK